MITIKYKGRTFTNGRSLAQAMNRDMDKQIERRIRQAAAASGVRVRKTPKGFEVEGDSDRMDRFHKRLGK